VYAKFRCDALRIKKALGIFRELIPGRTTRVAFWDPPSGFCVKIPKLSLGYTLIGPTANLNGTVKLRVKHPWGANCKHLARRVFNGAQLTA